jgi:hypothetical protein
MKTVLFPSRRSLLRTTALAACLVPVLVLSGCSDDDDVDNDLSRVEGRVQGNGAVPVAGATVTLNRIEDDGTLEDVSEASVTSSPIGFFSIETSLNNTRNLIVVAEEGNNEWQAIVTGEVEHGETIEVAPLNRETTVEAKVYREIVADGHDDEVSVADVTTYIDANLANAIFTNDAAIEQVADAMVQDAQVFSFLFSNAALGITPAQRNAITAARLQARYDLDRALLAANGDEGEIEAAYEDYFESDIEAFTNAGVDADVYARIREASVRALLGSTETLSPDLQFIIAQNTSTLRAQLIANALETRWITLNPNSTQQQQLQNAGVTLREAVASASTTTALRSAYTAYHNAIITSLQSVLPTNLSNLVFATDVAVTGVGGPRATLITTLDTAGTPQALANAYLAYFTAVRQTVVSQMPLATEAQIDAVTEALILANLDF